ncbi:DNA gyrase inhibitor YacG [Roseivivax sp. CAU 1753]
MSCPICSAPSVKAYRPFCSRRCADLDLAKWFSGGYAVPSDDPEDMEEALDAALAARAREDGESTH